MSALLAGIIFDGLVVIIFAVVFVLIGIWAMIQLCCNFKTSINFILGPSYITVEEIGCYKKVTNYQPGQLLKIELICQPSNYCNSNYLYRIIFKMRNNDAKDKYFLEIYSKNQIYTPEEIGYFNYVMNHHIQTKM